MPSLAKWADIVAANDKAFAIDPSTDSVDAKKEYALVAIDGSSSGGGEVTPVRPE